jgi:hypothetical protein
MDDSIDTLTRRGFLTSAQDERVANMGYKPA